MQTHNLKIDAHPFADLLSGAKTGEVRNDDRGFEVGDTVHLTCIDGQTMDLTISHIQRGYGLPDGICVLSYTRPAAPVEGLETKAWSFECAHYFTSSRGYYEYRPVLTNLKPDEYTTPAERVRRAEELVTRSQAEAIIAAERNRAEVAEYKLDQAVNTVQPMIIQRAERAEAYNAALTARVKELEIALARQSTNMAFVLNHMNTEGWFDKFTSELSEDRAALEDRP
ncbi:DUF3850 domain-containing protein [Ochrobactrum sp. EDr1-4]|uniref:DUF3850 domain-containing protein n=1 Tax=Ochrobactrum sp. EDr1-4 TaxID=3368622 RepID=UPI003B9E41BF